MTESTVLPNTFQNPNDFVDRAMEFLTGAEYKCLSFAVRHIFGWQESLSENRKKISLTMFQTGYSTEGGRRFGGTGLSRDAVSKSVEQLVKFKLLVKGNFTDDGQEYGIGDNPDWEGLQSRGAATTAKNRKRTTRARSVKADPAGVCLTDSRSVQQTPAGLSDRLNQTQQTHKERDSAPQNGAVEKPKRQTKPRPPDELYDAIYDIWHYTAAMNGLMKQMLLGTATRAGWAEYKLETPIANAQELREWAGWYRRTVLDGRSDLNMLEERAKIQSSIAYWRSLKVTLVSKQATTKAAFANVRRIEPDIHAYQPQTQRTSA